MFKANNLACKVAIDDSSEASLLGIKVSFMPVLGAIKISDVVFVVMVKHLKESLTEYHVLAKNPLKFSAPNVSPPYAQGYPNVV